MSYPINQKINPYQQQSAMGANNNASQLQMQNVDPNAVAQNITNNSALKGIQGDDDSMLGGLFSPKTFLISIPVWIGMCLGFDKFNTACGNLPKSNILNKLSQMGDTAAKKVKPLETFFQKISEAKTKFMEKFVTPKHKILYSIFKTPAKPEHSTAIGTAAGPIGEVANDATAKFKMHLEDGGKLYLDNKELSIADVEELSKNAHSKENIDKIIEICEQNAKKTQDIMQIKRGGKIPLAEKFLKKPTYFTDVLPLTKKIFLRDITFSEYSNKLNALKSTLKSESIIGKSLPKIALKGVAGLVQGMSGGKIGILMSAYFIAEAIKKGIEAPKGHGEKRKTFIENFVYNIGFFLTMPLAAAVMYRGGGLKYLGMTEKDVAKYRETLKNFNKDVESGLLADKAKYIERKKELKSILKGDLDRLKTDSMGTKIGKTLKNIIYKPLKLAGKMLDVGLERIKPYFGKDANVLEKFAKNIPSNLKRGTGFVLRFGLFMTVISPFLAKLCAQASDAVFGKPTKSVLDEGKEHEKEKEKQIISPIMPQQLAATQVQALNTMQPTQQNANLAYSQSNIGPRENLVDMYKTAPTTGKPMISSPEEPARRYIPSSDGVKIDPNYKQHTDEQYDKYEAGKKKSDNAQKAAIKYIPKETFSWPGLSQ